MSSFKVSYLNTSTLKLSKVKKIYTYEEFRNLYSWNSDYTVVTFNPNGLDIEVEEAPESYKLNNNLEKRAAYLATKDCTKDFKITFNGKVKLPSNTSYWYGNYSMGYNEHFKEFDGTNLDFSEVTNVSYMFQYCNCLTKLLLPTFTGDKLINLTECFYRCDQLTTFDIHNFTGKILTSIDYGFYSAFQIIYPVIYLPNLTGDLIGKRWNDLFEQIHQAKVLFMPKFTGKSIAAYQYMGTFLYNSAHIEKIIIKGSAIKNIYKCIRDTNLLYECQSPTLEELNDNTTYVFNIDEEDEDHIKRIVSVEIYDPTKKYWDE